MEVTVETAIRVTRDEQNVVMLTFDTPGKPVNTFSPAVLGELAAVLDQLQTQPPAGLIFASAKTHNFVAGADLVEVRKMNSEQLDR